MDNQRYITNECSIKIDTIKEHGDNGMDGDQFCSLQSADDFDGLGGRWYYMTTNGDDVLIGWIDCNSEEGLDDEIAEWINDPGSEWLVELLPTLGFDLAGVAA